MGEKIKTLSKGVILKTNFEVELNHPVSFNQDQQIHIQSDNFRFEIDKSDYIKYALSVMLALRNFKNLKKIK